MASESGRRAGNTRINSIRGTKSGISAYIRYQSEPAWRIIERGIRDLVRNTDLEERTPRQYVVGYLCKLLRESGVLRTLPGKRK